MVVERCLGVVVGRVLGFMIVVDFMMTFTRLARKRLSANDQVCETIVKRLRNNHVRLELI